ncbi:MAG: hypothetical protein P4L59_14520 [Desulfosporosinus sp.]|nr:hypothetical protein [Desulfosporosinus sp.]
MSEEQLRKEINRLANRIPIEKLETVILLLESLVEQQRQGQTWEEALANPIYDDEPVTEEEEQAVAEAKEAMKAGEFSDWEEVKERLGLSRIY